MLMKLNPNRIGAIILGRIGRWQVHYWCLGKYTFAKQKKFDFSAL